MPPVSYRICEIRHQFMAAAKSMVSTRFDSCTPVNSTSGTVTVPPGRPLCDSFDNHRPARVPSPGSGKVWVSVHRSTSVYDDPFKIRVVTVESRLVDQNDGLYVSHVDPVHSWSQGVSGQCASSWVPQPERHRSATAKSTRAGALAANRLSAPPVRRVPYST